MSRFAQAAVTPLTFRVGELIVEVRLRVVALGADGSVLGRSTVATVVLAE